MNQIRRNSTARLISTTLLCLLGIVLLVVSVFPSSQAAIARALFAGEVPGWLDSADKPSQLYTEYALSRLSGHLILFGAVDATACENGGLNAQGNATDCGIKAAQPAANAWQNQFNAAILSASQQENVPPRMLKNIFAWESQFWPETLFINTYEYGLGHMTLNGADSALRWNPALYADMCAASFSKEFCKKTYGDQPTTLRSGLQGALVQKVNADCSGCRYKLDLTLAEKSIPYFAKTLQANAMYVRYAIKIFTGISAADQVSVDDQWRLTLTSYNAGPGCFRQALSDVYYRGLKINWDNIKNYLQPACRGSIPYVEFISRTDTYHPENDPALHPTVTPEVQVTETPPPPALDQPHTTDEIVVKISELNLENAVSALQKMDISVDQVSAPIDTQGTRIIHVPAEKYADVLTALRSAQFFNDAEPNYLVQMATLPLGYPDDPQYSSQANLTSVQVPAAWDTLSIAANPGQPVLVAVLDTGVDTAHPDLAGRIWTNPGEICGDAIDNDHNGYVDDCYGWDMVNGDNVANDDNGHGTKVAGVIGAVTNNTIGIAGIAPNARILPVKVLGAGGIGTHVSAAEGIIYAANMGARIINIGFAGSATSAVLQNAVTYALSKGVIIIAPAGNDGAAVINYPASYTGVISVAAVQNDNTIASFSTSSSYISLVAPGVNILSTAPGSAYQTASGTSMAAAHVSGVAVMLAGQPQFLNQPELLSAALINTARDLGTSGRDAIFGYGVVSANDALFYATSSATVQISSPASGLILANGQSITFTGSAVDGGGGNVTPSLVWTSNIDGPIGTGASFSTSRLTPGAHTITASVTGGSASVNVRIMETTGPHGDFTLDTEACIICHSTHADTGGINAASAGSSNAYCQSCHNGRRAKAVSTHSNLSSQVASVKQEQDFELLCIQCHDPHGNTGNIFAMRTNLYIGSLPTHFGSMAAQTTGISFTSLTPTNLDTVCKSCHLDTTNPGFPMVSHPGGANHAFGDYSTTMCTSCHYHDYDGDPTTKDGFMPNFPSFVHVQSQDLVTPTANVVTTQVATVASTSPAATPTPTATVTPAP